MNDIKKTITQIMSQKHHSQPDKIDLPKTKYTSTAVPANKKAPPLEGGHYTKNVSMWILKHDISSPKFYEILIKIELKVGTTLELNKFYNHIKMCLNVVNRIGEDLLPDYQSIKRHSEF